MTSQNVLFADLLNCSLAAEKPSAPEKTIEINGDAGKVSEDVLGCDVANPKEVEPSYLMLLARENGNFYIYSIPDLQLVYRVKKLHDLPELLINTPMTDADYEEQESTTTQQHDFFSKLMNFGTKAEDIIMEIRLHGLGFNNSRPVLSILVDDIVWFYEMYTSEEAKKGSLMVKFRKLDFSVITRSTRFMSSQGKNPIEVFRDAGRRRLFVHAYDRIGDLVKTQIHCKKIF